MALGLDGLTLLLLTHIKPLCLGAAILLFPGPQGVPCLLWSCQIPWYLSWSAVSSQASYLSISGSSLRGCGILPCLVPLVLMLRDVTGAWRANTEETRPLCDPSVHPSLDLDAWINEPPSDSESEDEKPKAIFHEEEPRHTRRRQPEEDEEELARVSRPFQEYPACGRSSAWDLFT